MEQSISRFIVLADCRCGGTALVRTLNSHPQLTVFGELLSEDQPDFEYPSNMKEVVREIFKYCNGWHLQRFQIKQALDWYKLASYPRLKVIDLRRDNILHQYSSFRLALETKLWHERPEVMPKIKWNKEEYEKQAAKWVNGRLYTDHVFTYHPKLDVTFEQIVDNFPSVLQKCQKFLGVDQVDLEPAMQRMETVNYNEVFEGWPG